MKTHPGSWLLLVAGCATQPAVQPHPGPATLNAAPSLTRIRVGVEVLADEAAGEFASSTYCGSTPHVAAPEPPGQPDLRIELAERGPQVDLGTGAIRRPLWVLDREEITELDDPVDRVTARFLFELAGADRDRLHDELGARFLANQQARARHEPSSLWVEGQDLADEEEALQEIGMRLLRKPALRALRELPLARDLELEIEDFKAHHVPTSGAYRDSHGDERRSWGRLSLRWRLRDASDPLAVTWVCHGWRWGLSQETVRSGYSARVGDAFWIGTGVEWDHARGDVALSGEVKYTLDLRTRVRFLLGNQINPFPGSSIDRILASKKDADTSGAMVFVETIF